jgi:hypothetical protein
MGQLFVLFVLTVVVAEFVIGLALLVITFWISGTIVVEFRATIYIAYNWCQLRTRDLSPLVALYIRIA